ncbi:MAG TPA: CRISPR-associated protein Cas4 [Syntrophaceae bacterium]|nr:CRISPR-associated protein Cas4 [Syntrophaceae bacterium]
MRSEEFILNVSDVKQYFYCPRIPYFLYLIPNFRPITYKMEEGKLKQKEEERLEKRRSLSRFDLKEGEKHYNLKIFSQRLGLSGHLDMAISTKREVIPVDFKDGSFSKEPYVPLHHKYQLICYGFLLEEYFRKPSLRGFIHSLEDKKTREISFTEGAKSFTYTALRKIRHMISAESMPPPTRHFGRCRECEFKQIC